jgi:hypothetical protein
MIALWSHLKIGVMEPRRDRTMEPLHDRGYGATLILLRIC